jgi:hypothetical protein
VVFGGVLPDGGLAAPDVWLYAPKPAPPAPVPTAASLGNWSSTVCDYKKNAPEGWNSSVCNSTATVPPPRLGHTASYAPPGELVVYGGMDAGGTLLPSDAWVYNICTCPSVPMLLKRLRCAALTHGSAARSEQHVAQGAPAQQRCAATCARRPRGGARARENVIASDVARCVACRKALALHFSEALLACSDWWCCGHSRIG